MIRVGDRVRVSFSMTGTVIRLVRKWGQDCAVIDTGEHYSRTIPVGNLTKLDS